jgi:hypothetical protein
MTATTTRLRRRTTARRWQLRIVTTLALAFVATAGPALAATHYAATTGSPANWPCSTAQNPCDLTTAINGTGTVSPAPGDEVIIEGGTYTLVNTRLIAQEIDVQAAAGQAVRINESGLTGGYAAILVQGVQGTPAELEHVAVYENGDASTYAIEGDGDSVLDGDTGEATGDYATGVATGPEASKVLDTVAVETSSTGTALAIQGYAGTAFTVRNVTAVAQGAFGTAISADVAGNECKPAAVNVSILNTVAPAPDANANALAGSSYCAGATLDLNVDYSDLDPAKEQLGTGTAIMPGAHNIDQAPIFDNSAPDPYDEMPNSPTVDKGTNDPQDGTLDVDGRPRFLGEAPDIGAAELPAPYPVTELVAGLSTTGATLTGTVDSEGSGLTTSYDFQYGTSTNYGSFLPVPLGTEPGETAFPDPQPVVVPLTGLQPGTTYDYRLVAKNSDGRTFGANQTFTTEAPATLSIRHGGNGEGNILVDGPTGMIAGCLDSCPVNVLTETPYTLRARPLAGSSFAGWSGGGCSGSGMCTVTPSGNAAVTATFAINRPRLSRVSLSKRKQKLSLTVTAGEGNSIIALRVILPADLQLLTAKHGVKVSVKHATAAFQHGTLRLFLGAGARSVHVTLTSPAIRLVKRKHPQLDLVVNATESARGYEAITRLVHRT